MNIRNLDRITKLEMRKLNKETNNVKRNGIRILKVDEENENVI